MKYICLLLILLLSQCAAVNIVPLAIEDNNKNKNISLIEKYIEEPYQVDGKWFYPRDYKSYTEVGIAEMEIELNNGDLTTNKEFFHNDVHSGSHRSLPLPSIILVTNLENGRTTKVRVNNRGAYSSTHIINLSSGVFKELNLNSGGGLVKIELINTNESFILSETQTFEESPSDLKEGETQEPEDDLEDDYRRAIPLLADIRLFFPFQNEHYTFRHHLRVLKRSRIWAS